MSHLLYVMNMSWKDRCIEIWSFLQKGSQIIVVYVPRWLRRISCPFTFKCDHLETFVFLNHLFSSHILASRKKWERFTASTSKFVFFFLLSKILCTVSHLSTAVAWREKICKHFVFNKYFSLVLGVLKSKISKKSI